MQKVPGRDRTLYKAAQGDSSIQIIECNVTIMLFMASHGEHKNDIKASSSFPQCFEKRKERGEGKKTKKNGKQVCGPIEEWPAEKVGG